MVSNLRPFTTYTCSVAASTSIGQGPPTATVLQTTPEDGKPESLYEGEAIIMPSCVAAVCSK